MRSQAEVLDRIRELLREDFEVRLREYRERYPHRCRFNVRHTLDDRRYRYGEENPHYNHVTRGHQLPVLNTMGLCGLPVDASGKPLPQGDPTGEWNADVICDDVEVAQQCPWYTPKTTPREVLEQYLRDISDPGWLKDHLPEVYHLMWVVELTGAPNPPWWRRLWYALRVRVLRVDPVAPNVLTTTEVLLQLAPKAEDPE